MSESLSIDFSRPVPLFPLANCTLLPHATIPLHIFEPRYRRMTKDALDSRGLIAMAIFDGDQWKEDYAGNPSIRPYVCVGHIMRHERLADGRYNMLLQGVCRARIIEEVPHDPYRLALVEPTEPETAMEIDLVDDRRRIEELLDDPLLRQLASVSAIHNWLNTEIPTGALVDLAIITVCDDTESRYRMLAEAHIGKRTRWLGSLLMDLRHTLAIANRLGPGRSPDGWGLN